MSGLAAFDLPLGKRCLFVLALIWLVGGCGAKPDLIVVDFEIPEVLESPMTNLGNPVPITIANVGSAAANRDIGPPDWDFVHVDAIISTDENVPESGGVLETVFTDDGLLFGGRTSLDLPIEAGERRDDRFVALSVVPRAPPGGYFICVNVDPYNSIDEVSETNNHLCKPLVIDENIDPEPFCLDFERSSNPLAVSGLNATMLYADRGIWFPSAPEIFEQPPLVDGYQGLLQGTVGAVRPERSCAVMEFRLSPELLADRVELEARNLGFIAFPVHVTAVAYGDIDGAEVEVDRFEVTNQSQLGRLSTFERVTLTSQSDNAVEEPPITRVTLEYGTCPPRVLVDNLCVSLRE